MTPLDQAHGAMEAAPDTDALRLGFYERLADSELFLLLEEEPVGDIAKPMIFPVEDQQFALVFDREERLVEFTRTPSPFISLSGRMIATMLNGQGIGLGVNLSVAPSSILLPDTAVTWLAETLAVKPEQAQAKPVAIHAPGALPEGLIRSLDTKLATMAGLAKAAYLAEVDYNDAPRTHVIAFVGAIEQAQDAITSAISEALTFSGVEAGTLDVMFLRASDPICVQFAKVALRFDLPELLEPKARAVEAPGSNPDKPPKLR
ncbi:MAG: SseB family protein [Proteobacteria bacterium]|nr:SseB family protein [Pseudomonadota bacterium]